MNNINIFFDLDGTIWDLKYDSRLVLNELYYDLCKKYNLPEFTLFYNTYNQINIELWEKYKKKQIDRQNLEKKRFKDTFEVIGIFDDNIYHYMYSNYSKKLMLTTTLYEGAKETLEKLSKKIKLHIITNGFKEVQLEKLNRVGIKKFFDIIILAEDEGVMKPDLQLFKYALFKAKAKANNTFMIGDDIITDLLPAKELSMHQIYFNNTNKNHDYTFTLEV
ncbi:MAG TPA: HAD-IA family hydrolase, partial [Bacteroidales bacterium]|nr:HAD-IA family hydrolase [Bacteroidales bacterium]